MERQASLKREETDSNEKVVALGKNVMLAP